MRKTVCPLNHWLTSARHLQQFRDTAIVWEACAGTMPGRSPGWAKVCLTSVCNAVAVSVYQPLGRGDSLGGGQDINFNSDLACSFPAGCCLLGINSFMTLPSWSGNERAGLSPQMNKQTCRVQKMSHQGPPDRQKKKSSKVFIYFFFKFKSICWPASTKVQS